ncbi:hypothetical protein [Natrinema marinum]|uniref:hypothetical protein n=1 Tax=Natrinema marinum TaxID=2961598 RepID=UPI0020C8510A|nr:hypothetical protein [Natrinema marinum]
MSWSRDAAFDRAYVASIIVLPLLAVAGVLVPYLLGITNFAILGLYLAVPMVLASIVLWRLDDPRFRNPVSELAVDWRLPSVAFHVAVTILILSLTVYDVRPLTFYAGIAFLYTVILLLIWIPDLDAGRTGVCLYHTFVAISLVIFSVTHKYDFFLGFTDLAVHVSIVNRIVETGTLVSIETYGPFQFWHVYAAMTHQLLGGEVTTHRTVYLLGGLVYGAGVFAMYGLARRLYPSGRVALLAPLIAISHPLYIFYGMYSIPRSVTSVLFLTLLVALVGRPTRELRLVALAFVFAIVIYHPVSIPFVFVALAVIYAVERLFRSRPAIVSDTTLITAGLITLTYWLYSAEFLVERIVWTLIGTFSSSGGEPSPAGVVTSPWAEVANYVPYSFFVFFVLLGALLWLREESATRSAAAFGVSTLILLPLSVPGPVLLLDSLVGVNIGRFGHYTFMFLSLTAAVGVHQLITRGGRELFVVIVLVMAVFSFAAVSNDFVARDNPVVERPFYTYYLTEQERQSFEHIDEQYAGPVVADRSTCRYMVEMIGRDCTVVNTTNTSTMLSEPDSVLLREGELERRPLQFDRYVYDDDLPRWQLTKRDRVYDSGSVVFYT